MIARPPILSVYLFSDAYTTEDLVFHWRKDAKAVEVNEAISLPEYHLRHVTAIVCSQNINSTGMNRVSLVLAQLSVIEFVCLSVNQGVANHNRKTQRLVILRIERDELNNTDNESQTRPTKLT